MENLSNPTDVASFIDNCRSHALKVTPQRVAIYEAIADSKAHPSAEMVFQDVRDRYPNISYDTVNRTLLTFAKIGLLDVLQGQGGPRRFDPDTHTHHHFHCVHCGNVVDFEHSPFNDLVLPSELSDQFTVLKKSVLLNGVCKACGEKETSLV
jgi:Fur family transcriptional regulator, peroxide stress response regulator